MIHFGSGFVSVMVGMASSSSWEGKHVAEDPYITADQRERLELGARYQA